MNITTNNANVAYAHAEDLTSTAQSGYYKFGIENGEFKNQGSAITSSDDLMTVAVPIQEGDIIINNTQIVWSDTTSAGLMNSTGNVRILQIRPLDKPTNPLAKLADITHYEVTAEDIASGANTLIVTYRISTQSETFYIKRIRA